MVAGADTSSRGEFFSGTTYAKIRGLLLKVAYFFLLPDILISFRSVLRRYSQKYLPLDGRGSIEVCQGKNQGSM